MPNQIPDDCPQGQPDARPAPARSARLLFKAATHAHSTRIRAPGMRRIEKFLKYNPLTRAFKRRWCRWRDSNPRPPHYECDALPAELHRHCQSMQVQNYTSLKCPMHPNCRQIAQLWPGNRFKRLNQGLQANRPGFWGAQTESPGKRHSRHGAANRISPGSQCLLQPLANRAGGQWR